MTARGRSCHSLCICAVNSPVSRRLQLPSQRLRHALLAKDLVTWQAIVGRHILEDIVGRVAQNCPHTVTPCEIAVCRSTINAGSTAGRCASRHAVVISTETESGFITEDDTLQSVTLQKLPEVDKNPVDTAYDGVSGKRLSGRRLLANFGQSSPLWFLLMALDVWKEVSGVESMLATLLVPKWPLLIARSSRSFVFLGRPDLRDGTLYLL
ncbi:hypothetical protein TNCV_1967061 [Trichonephila clavipes]|nr:hypothetical protein TNCV_1967061 [Trichonephila clavipes]